MKTKTLITALLLLYSITTTAQVVSIPDPNFKWRLLNHTLFGGVQIDTNYDGEIQVTEAEVITFLDVGSSFVTTHYINDITGIEAFINLTGFDCTYNNITTLNLGGNIALTSTSCNDNQLTYLNISQNSLIGHLYCQNNQLTSLDTSNNPQLWYLNCQNNLITTLDFSQNSLLENLYCAGNQLYSLNVSQNALIHLIACSSNQLINIEVSNCLDLFHLFCSYNSITNLDLSQNTELRTLWGGGNQYTSLDLSQNNLLFNVKLDNTTLISLDVRNGNNEIIDYFYTLGSSELTCIFVDDADYSSTNWTNIDPASTFVETQVECDAIGIEEVQFSKNFTIYPNPTTAVIKIISKNFSNQYQITIFDILGRDVFSTSTLSVVTERSRSGVESYYFNISHLPKGIYYLTIKLNNQIATKKIIKL